MAISKDHLAFWSTVFTHKKDPL